MNDGVMETKHVRHTQPNKKPSDHDSLFAPRRSSQFACMGDDFMTFFFVPLLVVAYVLIPLAVSSNPRHTPTKHKRNWCIQDVLVFES